MHGLYAWLRRNPELADGVLALLVLGAGSAFVPGTWARNPALLPVMLLLGVPVIFRRAKPVAAFATVIVVGLLQLLVSPLPTGGDIAVMVLLYTLAARRPRRESLLGLAACLVGAGVACVRWGVFHHGKPVTELIVAALLSAMPLVAWLLGDSVRWRRGYYAALEERATRLERERDAFAQVAAAAERARIAREMHDVVAHHVSVMVVQADGAAFALDRSPDRAREAIGAISQTGRQALSEMRRLLGVLRAPDGNGGAALEPMPGVADIDELISQTSAGGMAVSLTVEGEPRPLPGGPDLAAYRVVQESLTNVRKHAGPLANVDVTLSYRSAGLAVRVTDDGRGAAAQETNGHGLTGMRERLALYGGTVNAGPRPGGGYQVTAWLPVSDLAAQDPGAAA